MYEQHQQQKSHFHTPIAYNHQQEEEEDEEGASIYLDENGFPQDKREEEGENPGGSFAAEFYRCGTDWSNLMTESSKCDSNKKMKQVNLFQMWGIKKQKNDDGVENGRSNQMKQVDLFQMWGIKKQKNDDDQNGCSNQMNKKQLSKKNGSGTQFWGAHSSVQSDSPSSSSGQFGVDSKRKPRFCPFYKRMPGTSFTVDAFRYGDIKGCSAYFLSHFHADHYGGLSKAWPHGPIYCTPITARLVKMCLYVNPSFICPLDLDVEYDIDGVKVTMLEANHCPGAALIHFRLPDGQCYLHTGDFRACKTMQNYPLLVNKQVDLLYLDTTYCNPKYRFPSKEAVTNFVVKTTKACLKNQPRTLVIVGAYSIGKECVYIAISEALKVKIHANASRRRILQSFDWPMLSKNLCSDGKETPLHVLPISSLQHETLKNYLQTYKDHFSAVVAFRPTGWTFSESIGDQLDLIKPNAKGNIQIYGVPYSEHSSFTELKEFVQFLRPKKIIATVNISSAATREKQQSYFRQWLNG